MVYAALKEGFREFSTPVLVSSGFVSYILTGNPEPKEWQNKAFNVGLKELSDNSLLDIEYQSRFSSIVCLEKIKFKETDGKVKKEDVEHFTIIEPEESKVILNYTGSKSDLLLFRLFAVLISTTHKDTEYNVWTGTTTQDYQLSLIKMVYNTYLKYYKILENDLGLIHTYRSREVYYNEGNEIKTGIPNTYGRKDDAEYIDIIGKKYIRNLKHNNTAPTKKLSKEANNNRSIGQLYFHWMGGKDYTPSTLKKIYQVLYKQNIKNRNSLNKEDRIKDLTKFKQYDFYKGEGTEEYETDG